MRITKSCKSKVYFTTSVHINHSDYPDTNCIVLSPSSLFLSSSSLSHILSNSTLPLFISITTLKECLQNVLFHKETRILKNIILTFPYACVMYISKCFLWVIKNTKNDLFDTFVPHAWTVNRELTARLPLYWHLASNWLSAM